VAAGAAAYAVPRLAGRERPEGGRPPGVLEWALAASLALYGIQSSYSADFGHALENVVFFYVPFALLFALILWIYLPYNYVTWANLPAAFANGSTPRSRSRASPIRPRAPMAASPVSWSI
jgi:hypothetical protein